MGRAKRHSPAPHGTPIHIEVSALRAQFRTLRARHGLSQAGAAALLGVSQATISAFENGAFSSTRPATLLKVRALVSSWIVQAGAEPTSNGKTVRTVFEPRKGTCRWCEAEFSALPEAPRFCPRCGGHQSRVCPCGAPCFDAWAKFCGRCGRNVGDAEDGPNAPTGADGSGQTG